MLESEKYTVEIVLDKIDRVNLSHREQEGAFISS